MISYISLEERVPQTQPLRKLRAVVYALLATMNREFEAVYARRGRPSVPPEMLLKACRKTKGHAAWGGQGRALGGGWARIQRNDGYKTSLKVRKRIEEAFGWA